MTGTTKYPRVRPLSVDEVCWELPSPWPKSHRALELALDALRVIEDELACKVIAELATAIVDQDEELAAMRSLISESMTASAAQRGQVKNARRRLAERLVTERRRS